MNHQPQINRKRSAFREKIRRQHIDKLFRQRRSQIMQQNKKYYQQKQSQLNAVKQIDKLQIPSNNSNQNIQQNIYPFHSQSIPSIPNYNRIYTNMILQGQYINYYESNQKEIIIKQFKNYEQFQKYIQKVIQLLPTNVQIMVNLFINHRILVKQFVRYLFSKKKQQLSQNNNNDNNNKYDSPTKTRILNVYTYQSPSPSSYKTLALQNNSHTPSKSQIQTPIYTQYPNLSTFLSKFTQCTLPQHQNYLHILQTLLLSQKQSSNIRLLIIHSTLTRIFARTHKYLQCNKIYKLLIYNLLFNYLIIFGQDIRVLKNVQIIMLCDWIKDSLNKINVQQNIQDQICNVQTSQIIQCVVVLCNNIIKLGNQNNYQNNQICKNSNNNKMEQLDKFYQTQQLKSFFINQLLIPPVVLSKKLCLYCLNSINPQFSNSHPQHLQHILRFFINLTYTISQPQQIIFMMNQFTMLLITLLTQYQKLIQKSVNINILILRLINNLIVSHDLCAQQLWTNLVISKIIQIFGFWSIRQVIKLRDKKLRQMAMQQNYETNDNTKFNMAYKFYDEPQAQVNIQFITTITNYISTLNTSASNQSQNIHNNNNNNNNNKLALHYNYIQNLHPLIYNKYIHLIILQSLNLQYMLRYDKEVVERSLQSLIILSNFQQNNQYQNQYQQQDFNKMYINNYNYLNMNINNNYNGSKKYKINIVNVQLYKNKFLFQKILDKIQNNNNITMFCESIFALIQHQQEQMQKRCKIDQENRKQRQMYQYYINKYANDNNNNNGN